jgi:hypothetical protein
MDDSSRAVCGETDARVDRRRLLLAAGVAAVPFAGVASAVASGPATCGVGAPGEIGAQFLGTFRRTGRDLSGAGVLSDVLGLAEDDLSGGVDGGSRLAFRCSARLGAIHEVGTMRTAAGRGRFEIVQLRRPAVAAADERRFGAGRDVASFELALQLIVATAEGLATLRGDLRQVEAVRLEFGGGRQFGARGRRQQLWATGPLIQQDAAHSLSLLRLAGNLSSVDGPAG